MSEIPEEIKLIYCIALKWRGSKRQHAFRDQHLQDAYREYLRKHQPGRDILQEILEAYVRGLRDSL